MQRRFAVGLIVLGAVLCAWSKYKPIVCSLFPIQMDEKDRWYVRQKGFKNERWELFCLNPTNSNVPAAELLRFEIALAKRVDDEEKAQK
jgi:hypothetical protein